MCCTYGGNGVVILWLPPTQSHVWGLQSLLLRGARWRSPFRRAFELIVKVCPDGEQSHGRTPLLWWKWFCKDICSLIIGLTVFQRSRVILKTSDKLDRLILCVLAMWRNLGEYPFRTTRMVAWLSSSMRSVTLRPSNNSHNSTFLIQRVGQRHNFGFRCGPWRWCLAFTHPGQWEKGVRATQTQNKKPSRCGFTGQAITGKIGKSTYRRSSRCSGSSSMVPTRRYWVSSWYTGWTLIIFYHPPHDQDYTNTILLLQDNLPSHRALISILQAFGASSPFASSSSMETEPSGTNGVAACFRLLTLVMDLYKSTVWWCLMGVVKHVEDWGLLCAKRSTFFMTLSLLQRHDKMIAAQNSVDWPGRLYIDYGCQLGPEGFMSFCWTSQGKIISISHK